MRKRWILGLTLSVSAVALGFLGRHRLEARGDQASKLTKIVAIRPQPPLIPIDDLNYQIQDRLHEFQGFGMSRFFVTPEHRIEFPQSPSVTRELQTESEDDNAVIKELERQGWKVAMYLAGRALLNSPMSKSDWDEALNRERLHRGQSPIRTISQPIIVSGQPAREALPDPRELWGIGQEALQRSPKSDQFKATFGDWSVDVRTVRADRGKCLTCHITDEEEFGQKPLNSYQKAQLEMGDALGVAIYIYARTPK